MKKLIITLLFLTTFVGGQFLHAQGIQFKVELLADGVTYQVSMKPSTTWTAPNNTTLGMQVTLLAPTGTFQLTNLTNINGNWASLPAIVAPSENPIKDYFVIYLTSSTTLTYTANIETPLFTFKRNGACTGSMELINNNTDPFMPPNSQSLNVGNYIATRGGGGSSNNLWTANYGGAASCPGVVRSCEVEYKLIPLSTGKYQVSMIPKKDWAGVLATTSTQQVTLVVPTGGFQVINLTNLVSGANYMQYSRFDAPTENTTKDYIVFNLMSFGTRNLSYVANVEVPLFTFENSGSCSSGNIALMDNATDPFRAPNSRSANVGEQLTTIGGGVDVPICLNTQYLAACSKACPNPSSNFLGSDGALCSGEESNLGIVSTYTNFKWTPTTGLSCSNCANPKVTITQDTRYIVTATNPQTGCPVRDTLMLFVLPTPVITSIDTILSTSCRVGNGTIIIRATVSSGDSLEYSIDNGLHWQDSPVFNNLAGGTYTLCTRTKIDRCVITFVGNPVFFRPATPPSVSNVTHTNPTDCGLKNGSITITATGGTPPFKYSINGGTSFSNSPIFNNLDAGRYTVVVSNADTSCAVPYPTKIDIVAKTPPTIDGISVTQITDCNNPKGVIKITASNGVAPLQYSINNGQTWQNSSIFPNLDAGSYAVQVRNADSSCVVKSSAVINPSTCQTFYKVQGRTYRTCDTNGIRTIQAQTMPNIVIILRGGTNVFRTTISDSLGLYKFDSVPQGIYNLTFGLPTGYVFGAKNKGLDRTVDSDVDPLTNQVVFTTAPSNGSNTLTFDAAYRDIEPPKLIKLNALLNTVNSGDTLTYSCANPPIFGVNDMSASDNSEITVVRIITSNDTFTRPVIRIQFVDVAQKIGSCVRDGYAVLLECEWRATDYCGNQSKFKIFIKITDDKKPVLNGVPANITVTSEADVPAPVTVTVTDNCAIGLAPVFQQTQVSTAQACEFLITRTWTATDDCGNSASASQQILVKKSATNCNLRLCPPSVLSQDSVVVTDACGIQPKACLNLPKDILSNYTLYLNNQLYNGISEGCRFDTAVSYSYFVLSNRGAISSFNLNNWVINGQSFSAENIPSVQALVDTMNRIDPNGRWLLDAPKYCITRTNMHQFRNYGNMIITYGTSGSNAVLQVNRTIMPYGTMLNIPRGRSLITLANKATGCTDSVAVYATCLTNGRIVMSLLKGQTKEECLDMSQMLGSRLTIKTITPLPSKSGSAISKNTRFGTINGSPCVSIKALNPTEKDSMVYVVTDEFGIHDTTVIVASVRAQSDANRVHLFNDTLTTHRNKHIVFDVLKNDSINSNRVTMQIVRKPAYGDAFQTSDWRVLYVPKLNYCDSKNADEFSYSVCTASGCDTAKVKVIVICDEINVHTGFSPNGDGVNDFLVIEGIELYPLSILRIYNRWGTKVMETTGYKNNWDGTWQGGALPDGTYFYQLDSGQNKSYSGYVQISR